MKIHEFSANISDFGANIEDFGAKKKTCHEPALDEVYRADFGSKTHSAASPIVLDMFQRNSKILKNPENPRQTQKITHKLKKPFE